MKVLEVILKAMAREIKWIQAADILGLTPRTIRRMQASYQEQGVGGLADRCLNCLTATPPRANLSRNPVYF